MENKNKNSNLLLFGALLGGAAGYYLASEDGKQLRQRVAEKLSHMGDGLFDTNKDLSDTIEDIVAVSKEKGNEISEVFKEKVAVVVKDLEETIANATLKAQETIDELEHAYNKSMAHTNDNKKDIPQV